MQQLKSKTTEAQLPAGKPFHPPLSRQEMEKIISVRRERQQSLNQMKLLPCRR